MKRFILPVCLGIVVASWSGCAGMKVVNPKDKNENAGTQALDLSSGTPKFVSTYTCKVESTGAKYSAIGKTEEDARKEVLAKCRDNAIITFCQEDQVTCLQN